MIKKYYKKIIFCGNYLDLYEYSNPIYYNFDPKGSQALNDLTNFENDRSEQSLTRARQNLYMIIKGNVSPDYIPLFLTLTFAENITDLKKANKELSLFFKRLKWEYKRDIKYVVVPEFQKRGAVHYHIVLFNLDRSLTTRNDIKRIWGKGFIDLKNIHHIRNLSAYVCKYISKDFSDKRLSRQKAFFCSRGIAKPDRIRDEKRLTDFLERNKMRLLEKTAFVGKADNIIKKFSYEII